MKRTSSSLLALLAALSAGCGGSAERRTEAVTKKEPKAESAMGTTGQRLLGNRVEIVSVRFDPGAVSTEAPYSISIRNVGSGFLAVRISPVFFSREGLRIRGGAVEERVTLAPGEAKTVSGSCPFGLASTLKVQVSSP